MPVVQGAVGAQAGKPGYPVPEVPQDQVAEGDEAVSLPDRISERAFALADLLPRLEAMTPEERGQVYEQRQVLKGLATEFCASIDDVLIELCEAGYETLVQTEKGPRRLYAAPDKRTTCNSVPLTVTGILAASGGDIGVLAQCLSSNAFKPGACRAVLGEQWNTYFTVDERKKLNEGSVKKSLRLARDVMEVDDGE